MPVPDLDVVEFADLLRPLPPHLPIPEASEASQRQPVADASASGRLSCQCPRLRWHL